MNTFGERLSAVRIRRYMTIAELSRKSGVAKQSIQGYEYGRNDPRVSFVVSLAKVLNVSLRYLAAGEGSIDEEYGK